MFQNIENVTYAEEAYFQNYKLFQKYLYYIFASSLMSSRKILSSSFWNPPIFSHFLVSSDTINLHQKFKIKAGQSVNCPVHSLSAF